MRTKAPTRRAACAGLIGLTAKAERQVAGGFVFESQARGHAIRDRQPFHTPARVEKRPLVIVGGGIGGLSAAWRLDKRGFHDFVVLEMEAEPGGNSRWGQNEVSAYPWAAHYVPVPNKESVLVRELFGELGLIVDGEWDERWLCHSPQERLFLHGRWQEGLEPDIGLTAEDHRQFRAFAARMNEFRATGEFRIPMEVGAPKDSPLDHTSFRQWMDANGFKSPYLHWLADYSTRDDYGASSAATSAWAGIHYFAARDADEKGPFTWPEGNGWIVRRLVSRLKRYIRTSQPVVQIEKAGNRWRITTPEAVWLAEAVVYAAPAFLLPYLDRTIPRVTGMEWSPWLTANLTLDRIPEEKGLEAAWDNVLYGSPSLGYVVATHQDIRTGIQRTVWTYYRALAHASPAEGRKELLSKDWDVWKESILSDLERAHRDIRQCVSRIDIYRNGHAMVRPSNGFLSNRERLAWVRGRERFYWASADASGISIFEEAQYRGVLAAERALDVLHA